eukprot:jgi/Botrbrau1/21375/Bobra.0829s0001.1
MSLVVQGVLWVCHGVQILRHRGLYVDLGDGRSYMHEDLELLREALDCLLFFARSHDENAMVVVDAGGLFTVSRCIQDAVQKKEPWRLRAISLMSAMLRAQNMPIHERTGVGFDCAALLDSLGELFDVVPAAQPPGPCWRAGHFLAAAFDSERHTRAAEINGSFLRSDPC